MPHNTADLPDFRRDGSSQASRVQAALAPEYVRIDERSSKDLLLFVQQYARELRYYTADNQPAGDWSAFLGDLNLDEVVAFMHDPTQVRPEIATRCARPHVALFLTFLHLLRHVQEHLNSLTRRHLDFYYRQVLHMTSKPGTPDRVNVLVDVTEDTAGVELVAGTLLHAGTDSLGQALYYRTDHTMVANRAQVARLSAVYVASRNQEGRAPAAPTDAWQNLYPAADATAVRAPLPLEGDTPQAAWKTFGQVRPVVRQDSPPLAVLGWAMSSPLLALSEGQRYVTLTLGFQPERFQLAKAEVEESLQVQISTARGWIEPSALDVKIDDYQILSNMAPPGGSPLQALQCVLTFDATVEALAALSREAGQIDSPWPVLRLMLRQIEEGTTGRYRTHYQIYKDLVLVSTHLRVHVTGLTTLQMQNDETVLPAHKPFEPFGSSPVEGARFSVGHPEVVRNTLDSLTFTIEWMGVPQANIAAHYTKYSKVRQEDGNGIFTARVSLVDKRQDMCITDKAPLFDTTDATKTRTIALAISKADGYERYPEMSLGDDLRTWDRYLQWELNAPDFQHGAYPIVAAQQSLALAAAIVNKKAGEDIEAQTYQVNPPYTPRIKHLRLDYTASVAIDLAAYRPGAQPDRLFHIHPFGYHEMQPDSRTQRYMFFPQYANEGELYIGLQDVRPPQNLTLLFQMAEGSADPDLPPVPIQWSYLSGNRWLSLEEQGHVLQDTTRGLINTGILAFALPPAQPSTLLPAHLYWLRAAIPQRSASVCDTIAIHTQAVSATFVDEANAPEHLAQPLPPGGITNLAEPRPEITGIRQPYTSYGGKVAEQDRHMYTRVSERLRHKHRALTIWDYEHMILERFPEVYKVKCLPATPEEPGRVEIVVIPDIRQKQPSNPFEPKAPADLLASIADYLADYSPAWSTVHVKNAHYVPVRVRVAVCFQPGYNAGFYTQKLHDELHRFLSPWAYEEGAEIEIGGRIYANVIINFLENRPYVDYVAHIRLSSSEDRGQTFHLVEPSASEGYWVQTDRADGILVAAQQHEIDLIPEAGYDAYIFTGIEYMQIGWDFIVGGD